MNNEAVISGNCPLCKKDTKFRELTFSENLSSLGSFVGSFLSGGLDSKTKQASTVVDCYSDSREFPNYKCGSCGGMVMRCSACEEIIPYEDDGKSHVCGAAKSEPQNEVSTPNEGDLISKLERLGLLREKGILTESEFEQQKLKLLQ